MRCSLSYRYWNSPRSHIKLRSATPRGATTKATQKPVLPPPNSFEMVNAMKAPIM